MCHLAALCGVFISLHGDGPFSATAGSLTTPFGDDSVHPTDCTCVRCLRVCDVHVVCIRTFTVVVRFQKTEGFSTPGSIFAAAACNLLFKGNFCASVLPMDPKGQCAAFGHILFWMADRGSYGSVAAPHLT